jgi:hypothetical protein
MRLAVSKDGAGRGGGGGGGGGRCYLLRTGSPFLLLAATQPPHCKQGAHPAYTNPSAPSMGCRARMADGIPTPRAKRHHLPSTKGWGCPTECQTPKNRSAERSSGAGACRSLASPSGFPPPASVPPSLPLPPRCSWRERQQCVSPAFGLWLLLARSLYKQHKAGCAERDPQLCIDREQRTTNNNSLIQRARRGRAPRFPASTVLDNIQRNSRPGAQVHHSTSHARGRL